jgi:hypothetical protein
VRSISPRGIHPLGLLLSLVILLGHENDWRSIIAVLAPLALAFGITSFLRENSGSYSTVLFGRYSCASDCDTRGIAPSSSVADDIVCELLDRSMYCMTTLSLTQ